MTTPVLSHLPSFEKARVLVIGDVFLDRYWFGSTQRISPEAPVPIVNVQTFADRAGGAGNVAVNLTALGVQTTLLGVIGNDATGKILTDKLEEKGVNTLLQVSPHISTITKTRVLSQQQQLIRLDCEEFLHNFDYEALVKTFSKLLPQFDAVILSDYHKGTLADPQPFITAAKKLSIPVIVDPKSDDFSIYRGAYLLTPNQKEFETAMGTWTTEVQLENLGLKTLQEFDLSALLVTRSAKGMSLIQPHAAAVHLPARAFEVRDVTGAGDTVIAVLTAALAAGENIADAVTWANIAAGLVVTKLGTATVTQPELRNAVHAQYSKAGILTEEEAVKMRAEARAAKEKIVMTNGCFDILHRGHIDYLEAAKALGDRLLIAVNDDASIARLKGEGRPVQSLQDRMTILAGLRAVDYVVAFSEDTPERLIQSIVPDVLVKGVDYQGETIVGEEFVLSHGGEVKRVGPEKRWSSSDIIAKLKERETT